MTLFLQDNSQDGSYKLTPENIDSLLKYAGIPLLELQKRYSDFLVFPDKFEKYGDDWNNAALFDWKDGIITTGNVVGFFGIDSLQIQIGSRFDEKKSPQYFLHHMLSRAFGINMVNLPANVNQEPIWDFLPYLFVYYLKRAIKQGVFRMYRSFERNDDHVRGAIDIPRHLRINNPFRGRIAYRTREHTENNALTHLIRHTIEAIRTNHRVSGLLFAEEDIRTAVRTITELTPDYSRYNLSKVIAKNLRSVRHPYYTEYAGLQDICLKILRHEKNTYGQSDDQLSGIVFKAEWLWEEYLASLLAEIDDSKVFHTQNSLKTSPEKITVYKNGSKPVYPDFFSNKIVFDAKYKKTDNTIKRTDRYQMISYLYFRKSSAGFMIYPFNQETKTAIHYEDNGTGVLSGYGGTLGLIKFAVPKGIGPFDIFQKEIIKSEEDLKKIVKDQINRFNQEPTASGTAN